jgi:hypothetical protein
MSGVAVIALQRCMVGNASEVSQQCGRLLLQHKTTNYPAEILKNTVAACFYFENPLPLGMIESHNAGRRMGSSTAGRIWITDGERTNVR